MNKNLFSALSDGEIAAIVLGCVAGVILVCLLIYVIVDKSKKKKKAKRVKLAAARQQVGD